MLIGGSPYNAHITSYVGREVHLAYFEEQWNGKRDEI